MKHIAILLAVVIVASALLPCTTVKAEPSFVPHEDPSEAQSTLDVYSFLSQYVEILSFISSEQYQNASALTEQLAQMTVPEDLSYIINRYNNLTQELIQVLSDLRSTLDSASAMLDHYQLDDAAQALDKAGVLVARAQILLSDLQDATTTLSQRLGIFAAPANSKIREAYNQLQGLLDRLKDLIDQYHALLQRIHQQVEEVRNENLQPTALSLGLNTTNCFVGEFVSAYGTLTSNEQSLQNRTVIMMLDGARVVNCTTNSNGGYFAVLQMPYKYSGSVTVNALYVPAGNDVGVYLGCSSPSVTVDLLSYKTNLDVSMPAQGYPGLPLTIGGEVTSQQNVPLSGREVRVLLDNSVVATIQTDAGGAFEGQMTIDTQAKIGTHKVTVIVDPKGRYAGTSQELTLSVVKLRLRWRFMLLRLCCCLLIYILKER
jgi:DNA-binding ferritin-like protein